LKRECLIECASPSLKIIHFLRTHLYSKAKTYLPPDQHHHLPHPLLFRRLPRNLLVVQAKSRNPHALALSRRYQTGLRKRLGLPARTG
jgi:hypothetical protein